jgi:hypothetical protein
MTGSISDDWILLALWLQSLLITLSHNTIAILHTSQSLHTNPLVFTIRFLVRIYNTWTIKVSLKYTLPISLHYGTFEVFTSHFQSSEADFFNYELPVALTANCLEPSTAFNFQLQLLRSEFASLISTLHTPRRKHASAFVALRNYSVA